MLCWVFEDLVVSKKDMLKPKTLRVCYCKHLSRNLHGVTILSHVLEKSRNGLYETGAPNVNFRKISVRKTI